ncbi:MAG: nitrogenase iron-molybdenum cofactor biosynthesis protein NifN [Pseudomonadota bacterium]|nr:nitrogenase iron-molybdenum cofactor biosynthesis protein NifN [Pseudomonadota bacterium]
MAEIVKRHKPLSVKPLKSSQPLGASLAFLGINNTIPLLHGSQGCTAFGKIFLIQHFREPIPLQTTAMDQVTTIMGADDNVIEGLKTLADKAQPDLVGVITTGLSETQGSDIKRVVKAFYAAHPECAAMKVVAVNTPDFNGCLESGFALAATAMINELVPAEQASTQPRQVNVLVGSFLTPGDIETLKEVIESFGLRPLVFPDIADALDGHVTERNFTPTSIGGLSVTEIPQLARSVATLVIGASMFTVADTLKDRTGISDYRFETLMGLEAFDQFLLTLQSISGQPVPARFERQRSQLQDAMLDTHFMLGQARFAIAADPDILYALSQFVKSMGGEIVTAVAPIYTELLTQIPTNEVKIGDLEDFEQRASAQKAQIVLSNAHAVDSAKRLGIPLLRVGFPQFDWVGGYQRTWIGYRGSRQVLFDLANLLLSQHQGIQPYRSQYAQADEPRTPEYLHTPSSHP